MTQLDDASDKIPEGLYLKFCDHLQNLHNKTGSFSRIGRGRHQTRVGTFEEAPQIPPNEHGYVDVQITKKRLTECMVSVTEPTGDLRVRVAVVAAARWVTIGVTAPTSSKT